VTWERNGKQYVTVVSGIGGVYAQRGGDPNLANLPTGVTLWHKATREAAGRGRFSIGCRM
jgi:hypothetical protein